MPGISCICGMEMGDRRTLQRYHGLAAFDFNPQEDIEPDETGCWRWGSDKPAMNTFVRDYFASRKEEGSECAAPGLSPVLQPAA